MDRTYQDAFYLRDGSLLRRLSRNLRLAWYVGRVTMTWLIVGGRVRRAHRRAQRSGEPMYIDSLAGDG